MTEEDIRRIVREELAKAGVRQPDLSAIAEIIRTETARTVRDMNARGAI